MRSIALLTAVLALALPVRGRAQTIQLSELAGTWERPHRHWTSGSVRKTLEGALPLDEILQPSGIKADKDTLIIRADSTFRSQNDGAAHWNSGNYKKWNYLKGDTLALYKNGDCIVGSKTCKSSDGGDMCSDGTSTGSGLTGNDCLRGEPGYKITLKEPYLYVYALNGTTAWWPQGIYKRVGPAHTP